MSVFLDGACHETVRFTERKRVSCELGVPQDTALPESTGPVSVDATGDAAMGVFGNIDKSEKESLLR